MAGKRKENQAAESHRARGKPRKYSTEVCRHVGVSMPPSLYEQLQSAARQTQLSRSEIVVAGLRQILAQSPDRLREAVRERRTPG